MKKLTILIALSLCSIVIQAQTKQKTDTLKMISWVKIDQDSIKVFYGLTAPKIVNMPTEAIKKFIREKKISASQFFTAMLDAENYLLELKIKKDSVELIQIYERIEKKLDMKKKNGNFP